MRDENGPDNGETHSGAFADGFDSLAAIKLLEYERQIDSINTEAVVLHTEFQSLGGALAAQNDAATGRGVPGSVLQQMLKHPLQQMRIEPGCFVWLVDLNHHVVRSQGRLRLLNRMLEERASFLRHGVDFDHVGVDLSHLHGFADKGIEPRGLFVNNGSQVEPAGVVQPFALDQCSGSGANGSQRSTQFVSKGVNEGGAQALPFSGSLQARIRLNGLGAGKSDGHLSADCGRRLTGKPIVGRPRQCTDRLQAKHKSQRGKPFRLQWSGVVAALRQGPQTGTNALGYDGDR